MGDHYGSASGGGGGHYGGGQKHKQSGGPALDQGKIFVGGLSWQTTEESLRWHFQQYGPVASVEVMKDRVTGDPRGFAFVVFQDAATVDLVMNEARHEINHKIVDVKRAQARGIAPPSIHRGGEGAAPPSSGSHQQSSHGGHHGERGGGERGAGRYGKEPTPEQLQNKVFVGGIPPNVYKDELKSVFEQFGPVVDAIVMVDQVTNRSRCFGFVTFENGSSGAQKALAAQPVVVQGRNVEIKLATPKEDQRRQAPSGGAKSLGLRAGIGTMSSGKYAGLAVAYARNGWKAGYGSYAFGSGGWAVDGWEDMGPVPEKAGFSFSMLEDGGSNNGSHNGGRQQRRESDMPATKRARY